MVVVYLLMYVNGVDKILGTPFNIIHPNTPQSLNNEHKAEFSPSCQKMYLNFINVEFIAELLYWIKLDWKPVNVFYIVNLFSELYFIVITSYIVLYS